MTLGGLWQDMEWKKDDCVALKYRDAPGTLLQMQREVAENGADATMEEIQMELTEPEGLPKTANRRRRHCKPRFSMTLAGLWQWQDMQCSYGLSLYKPEIQKQTDERLRSGSERRIASRIRPGQDSKTLQNFQDLQDH